MNTGLSQANIQAVMDDELDLNNPSYHNDPGVERKGMCSRFVRCATRKEYGQKYQGLFGSSAIASGRNFKDAGYVVPGTSPKPEPGDILFKMVGSGGFGHVGTFVGTVPGMPHSDYVAENSSTSIGRVPGHGAKGYRRIGQFGSPDLIGRLPAKEKEESVYRLFLNDRQIAVMPIKDGHAFCKVRTWTEALGLEAGWDEATQHVLIDGKSLPDDTKWWTRDGAAFVWIADLVKFSALHLELDEPTRKVTVKRPAPK